MERLAKNFLEFVDGKLRKLCFKYIYVFVLESEELSANNLYKQKLRLKDNQPVYEKNYRIAHSHKEEENKEVDKLISDDII